MSFHKIIWTQELVEKFCLIWNNAETPDEAAEKMGMRKRVLYTKASQLRNKHGLKIKRFAAKKIDYEKIKGLLNEQKKRP